MSYKLFSQIQKQTGLPNEIFDKILILSINFKLAIILNNNYVSNKLYKPKIHSWIWAAENGHLDIVKFLHINRAEGCTKDAMDYAARKGHLDVVKFLHINRTEGCTEWAMNCAAKGGHLDIVKYLH